MEIHIEIHICRANAAPSAGAGAPETSGETRFQPVPSALGLYLAFTAIRLWLAFERMGEVTVRGRATPTTVYAMRDLPMPAASVKLGRAEA